MKYVHYGHKQFLKQKFVEISNTGWVKPDGGLWASPVNADYGWKEWCKNENFRECFEDNALYFTLAAGVHMADVTMITVQKWIHMIKRIRMNRQENSGVIGINRGSRRTGAEAGYSIQYITVIIS